MTFYVFELLHTLSRTLSVAVAARHGCFELIWLALDPFSHLFMF